jgi:hypothetical protein
MVDASGGPQSSDQIGTEGAIPLPVRRPSRRSNSTTNIEVSSSVEILTSNHQINIPVIATISPVNQYQIIVNFNGADQQRQDSDKPWFEFPSVPGGRYAVKRNREELTTVATCGAHGAPLPLLWQAKECDRCEFP